MGGTQVHLSGQRRRPHQACHPPSHRGLLGSTRSSESYSGLLILQSKTDPCLLTLSQLAQQATSELQDAEVAFLENAALRTEVYASII